MNTTSIASRFIWVLLAAVTLVAASATRASAQMTAAQIGQPYSYSIPGNLQGGTPPSDAVYSATGLPSGLQVNTATGLITGTPDGQTPPDTYAVTLSFDSASEGLDYVVNNGPVSLVLEAAVNTPVISSAASAAGTVGTAFSYQIAASNSPTAYSLASYANGSVAALPGGLLLNTGQGTITGTPTAAGTFPVGLTAINGNGTGETFTLTLTIAAAAGVPVITSATTATATPGSAFSYTITASNSPTSFAAAPLPAGLSLAATTGVVSGTPTIAGVYPISLTATNAAGTSVAVNLELTVGAYSLITTSSLSAVSEGLPVTISLTASNSPTSFNVSGLPAGLTANPTTGQITGSATASGTFTVVVSANNALGTGPSVNLSLTVAAGSAPVITTQPSSTSVLAGASAAFTVVATGAPAPTYQWSLNGTAITGATSSTYAVSSAAAASAGAYTVVVTNVVASVTSASATLTVNLPPTITTAPQSTVLSFEAQSTLSVAATGTGPLAYQWSFNGSALAGATSSAYAAPYGGTYSVVVSNGFGSPASATATVTTANRLVNISTRADVLSGSDIEIPGFVIVGPSGSTKELLIRASGPTLGSFGVSGTIAFPELQVYDSKGATIVTNNGWGNAPVAGSSTSSATFRQATVADFNQVGAFGFLSNSADSAVVVTVPAGSYTVEVFGADGGTGVGLAEVYEMNSADSAVLVNISTRTYIGSQQAQIAIPGFVINGTQAATLLIRGVGPTLGSLGVPQTIANPILEVFDSTGAGIATDQGWGNAPVAGTSGIITGSSPTASVRAATTADFATTGAFGLNANSADSAMVITLPPGHYTAQVSGANSTTGATLVEVYQMPVPIP